MELKSLLFVVVCNWLYLVQLHPFLVVFIAVVAIVAVV